MSAEARPAPLPCPLCGADAPRLLKRFPDGVAVGRCLPCGFLYTPERHRSPETVLAPASLEALREQYGPVLEGRSHHYRRDHYRAFLDRVGRYVPAGRLLDVGCAHGFLGREARARGYAVTGVDPHPGMAAFAREENGLDVLEGTLDAVDLGERRFDVVMFTDSFDYVLDPVGGLRKVAAALDPGGVVFVKVPNALSSLLRLRLERLGIEVGEGAFSPSQRAAHYTRETLARTLEAAGLVVVEEGFPSPIHSPTARARREGRAELARRPGEGLPARAARGLLHAAGLLEASLTGGTNHLAQAVYAVARLPK